MHRAKLFGKRGCQMCADAKALLDASGIAFEYYDIESYDGMAEFSFVGWSDLLPALIWPDKRPVYGAAVGLRLPAFIDQAKNL